MNVISLEEQSFYELIDKVVAQMYERFGTSEPKWISEIEAMQMLGVRSKTTMQRLRDNDEIRFSQPRKKIILYYKPSLETYLDQHANK